MKRKIIKQGHNTLTITLPAKWVEKQNLKQGDELELIEKDTGLFIASERNIAAMKTEIDISSFDIPTIWKYFMAVYREGYDEIKVIFSPKSLRENPYKFFVQHYAGLQQKMEIKQTSFEVLNSISHRFIGWEIIEHRANFCIIKDMLEISSKEFDSSLRRVFLLIKQMGEELMCAIAGNDLEILKHTHDIDINVDKFHDFCVRILNKTGFKSSSRTSLVFAVLYLLELLGDNFKNISSHILSEPMKIRLPRLKEFAGLVLDYFNHFYDLFYEFNREKVVRLSEVDIEIYRFIPSLYNQKNEKFFFNKEELEILNHLRRITEYVNALFELKIEMECQAQ